MPTRLSTRASTRASTAASESLAETESKSKTKGDTRKTSSARSGKSSDAKLKLFRTRMIPITFVLSLFTIGSLYYAVMNDMVRFYPNSMKVDSLKGFNTRAEYSLRYQALQYFWILINIYIVIYQRVTHKALDPSVESTERHVQPYRNILSNSYEQIVLSSFLQLAFVSFADHSYTLKLIPAINILQFIGRLAFFAGYPFYRTFGFSMSITPNLLMSLFNVYKLGAYLNFY